MNSPFFESSREIANDFLQSIVFIDDRAFVTEDPHHHEFDAKQITRVFANSKKVCAVYNPETLADIDNLAHLAKKTDVTVLDWQINIKEEEVENGEEDAEDDDPRGSHTRKIIREILSDPLTGKGSLKLIVIYTGEIDLPGITDEIFKDLQALNIEGLQKGDCSVFTNNIKILVTAKPASDDEGDEPKFKHNPELNSKVVAYDDLPDFILTQFTEMTAGLLSNFALECLSTIRSNTFRILQLFNKKLDTAYLGHKVLLPSTEDSEDLLVDLMRDSLGDLLHYSEMNKMLDPDTVKLWLAENIVYKKMSFLDKKANPFKNEKGVDLNLNYVLTENLINELVFGVDSDVRKRFENVFKKTDGFKKLNKEQKTAFLKTILVNSSSLFAVDQEDHEELDLKFANLTHHKNLFKPDKYSPKLSLGTIFKGTINDADYWVCIQQKCDSVKLKKGEIRKFLFLPLKPEKKGSLNGFHFTDPNGQRLRLVVKTYGIRTIKFQDKEGNGVILAELVEDKYIFKQYYSEGHEDHKPEIDENFEWVFDLKDLHAQRISNDIAREISRVGLDESEWLRRWAT